MNTEVKDLKREFLKLVRILKTSDCLHLAQFIPIKPNCKEPIGKWLNVNLSVSECLSLIYRGYNIAIVGKANGLCFIDVDDRNAVRKLKIPPTLVVATPSGGYHYYFKNVGIGRNYYFNGIEFRMHNAYVLTVGSVVDDKCYKIVYEHKLSVFPKELLLLRERVTIPRQS